MEQRDYKMEFVYMDSYTTLLEGAQKSLKLLEAGQLRPLPSEWIARFQKNMDELENRYAWRSQGTGAQFIRSTNPFENASKKERAVIASVCPYEDRLLYAVNYGERCGLYLMDVDSPGKGESLVFSQMGQFIGGLSVFREKIALSVSFPSGRSSIALMTLNSADLSLITEGDVRDADPSFSRDGRSIYYASAGLGRSESGQLLAVGPSAILRLDISTGELSELPADENFDYLRPREGADGYLYCLRRPHKQPKNPRSNPLAGVGDFFRGMAAVGRLLSGKMPEAEKKQSNGTMLLDGMPIDPVKIEAENNRSGEEHPGLAPKDWTLVRLSGGEWEKVTEGAVDYAFAGNQLIISNGRYILSLSEDGKKRSLGRADGVIRLASLD